MPRYISESSSQSAQTISASIISGGGIPRDVYGSGYFRIFAGNGQFVVPAGVSKLRIRVVGGGGAGASRNGDGHKATGGAGGGFAMGEYDVTPGTTYAVTVGEGGQNNANSGTGTAGGTSSFGALLSATGGESGNYADDANACAGANGGTGTGGTIVNSTGGSSGSIDAGITGTCATGGGSSGSQFGDGCSSGSITGTTGSPAERATGGASAIAPSPSIDVTVTTIDYATGGAGTGGQNSGNNGGFDVFGNQAVGTDGGTPDSIISRFPTEILISGGGPGRTDTMPGYNGGELGGGGGAAAGFATGPAGSGGHMAGGGGMACTNGGNGGAGGFGGGGGGIAGVNGGNGGLGQPGGSGLVVVEW